MSLKCDSCGGEFERAMALFEHIQRSCLSYYKKNPASWTKILTSLDPTDESSDVAALESRNSGEATSTPQHIEEKAVYTCKCKKSFLDSQELEDHVEGCKIAAAQEPPFCIMFKAPNADAGRAPKNVHMTVNEYFYGVSAGKSLKEKKIVRRNNCYSCRKTLRNNIRFMSHLRHKIMNEWEKKADSSICNHCYRVYESPFHLQCHLETVHGSEPAVCTCQICELNFGSEKLFLSHMKDKHVHNEMPYVCKVCRYRSSFYSDVTKHFRDVHSDTSSLMCPFCLNIQHNSHAFLKHVLQHIKKGADCQRCRLTFVNVRERTAHVNSDHSSKVLTKKNKQFKNLSQCQVFVRVTSLTMTPRQGKSTEPSPDQSKPSRGEGQKRSWQGSPDTSEGISSPKRSLLSPGVQVPAYLCPLRRPTKIQNVVLPETGQEKRNSFTCWECKELIEPDPEALRTHYMDTFECRWCVYVTSCQHASRNHVLLEHADAELRQLLLGRSTHETANLAPDVGSNDSPPAVKAESDVDIEYCPCGSDETKEENFAEESEMSLREKTEDKLNWKARRKQSNPMKIAGQEMKDLSEDRKRILRSLSDKATQKVDIDLETVHEGLTIKQFRRPGIKILSPKTTPKLRKKTKLAPEDFFPDLGDDAGLTNHLNEVEAIKKQNQEASSFIPVLTAPSTVTATPEIEPGSRLPPLKPLKLKQISGTINAPMTDPVITNLKSLGSSSKLLFSTQEANLPQKSSVVLKSIAASSRASILTSTLSSVALPISANKSVLSAPALSLGTTAPTSFVAPISNLVVSVPNTLSTRTAKSDALLPHPVAPALSALSWTSASTIATPTEVTGPVYQLRIIKNDLMQNAAITSGQIRNCSSLTASSNRPVLLMSPRMVTSHVPQCPVDLRCLKATNSSLLIQWKPPRGCQIAHYKVVFQGSGPPTVQLLPPEQTLVRLVGLKSDTMYAVRVYSLCHTEVSQHAFLSQKTRKLRQKLTAPKVDVLEGNKMPQNATTMASKFIDVQPSRSEILGVRGNVPELPKEPENTILTSENDPGPELAEPQTPALQSGPSQTAEIILHSLTSQSPELRASKDIVTVSLPTLSDDSSKKQNTGTSQKPDHPTKTDLASGDKPYIDQEENEKRMLINELLEGFRKNKKIQKEKLGKQESKAVVEVKLGGSTKATLPTSAAPATENQTPAPTSVVTALAGRSKTLAVVEVALATSQSEAQSVGTMPCSVASTRKIAPSMIAIKSVPDMSGKKVVAAPTTATEEKDGRVALTVPAAVASTKTAEASSEIGISEAAENAVKPCSLAPLSPNVAASSVAPTVMEAVRVDSDVPTSNTETMEMGTQLIEVQRNEIIVPESSAETLAAKTESMGMAVITSGSSDSIVATKSSACRLTTVDADEWRTRKLVKNKTQRLILPKPTLQNLISRPVKLRGTLLVTESATPYPLQHKYSTVVPRVGPVTSFAGNTARNCEAFHLKSVTGTKPADVVTRTGTPQSRCTIGVKRNSFQFHKVISPKPLGDKGVFPKRFIAVVGENEKGISRVRITDQGISKKENNSEEVEPEDLDMEFNIVNIVSLSKYCGGPAEPKNTGMSENEVGTSQNARDMQQNAHVKSRLVGIGSGDTETRNATNVSKPDGKKRPYGEKLTASNIIVIDDEPEFVIESRKHEDFRQKSSCETIIIQDDGSEIDKN